MGMFEPKNHPNDFPYPGGPPPAPDGVACYTLAYARGLKFDQILDGFDCPFERLADVASRRRPAA